MYASGITFTAVASVSPSSTAVVGADNGLSPSAVTAGDIVLGQDVSELGAPATLLSNREIPMGGFFINPFGGSVVLTDSADPGEVGPPLQVSVESGDANTTVVLFKIRGSNTFYRYFANGGFFYTNPGTSPYLAGTPLDISGVNPLTEQSGLQYNASLDQTGGNTIYKIFRAVGDFTPTGGNPALHVFTTEMVIDTSGSTTTGDVHGFYVNWDIEGAGGTGKLIAFENVSGDVLLNSTNGSFTGRTGVHRTRVPTAWLHIGAGAAAASSAPLKFTSGTLQTSPEAGALEYNGVNFFATRTAGTREVILTGTSGAAAPATTVGAAFTNFYGANITNVLGTPNSWASVNIAGTVFKIPLYT